MNRMKEMDDCCPLLYRRQNTVSYLYSIIDLHTTSLPGWAGPTNFVRKKEKVLTHDVSME
jgi:hypothetical protein